MVKSPEWAKQAELDAPTEFAMPIEFAVPAELVKSAGLAERSAPPMSSRTARDSSRGSIPVYLYLNDASLRWWKSLDELFVSIKTIFAPFLMDASASMPLESVVPPSISWVPIA